MNIAARVLGAVLVLLVFLAPAHAGVSVQNLRQWRAPDHTRLVLDVSGPVEHRLFTLSDPHRVVVDLEQAEVAGELPEIDTGGPLLAALRTGRPDASTLRIVLDLKTEARPRSFLLKPAGQYGHRLVIDLHDAKAEAVSPPAPALERRAARETGPRTFVIAIDAGHGGEDPGAVGRRYRTFEKTVTLAVARALARRVEQDPAMRPVLIRDGDYYVGLQDRFHKARTHRADVFVSIHADAVPGRQASGSSVYALSEKGATDAMARFIADKENASDLIGGVSLNDKDDVLAKVLLDLSHTKTIHDSLSLGDDVLAELKRVGPVHHARVRQAGFMVLKAPDIPSVLVEIAFISNPTEEKKLRTASFQQRLAEGIYKGLKRFVARLPEEPMPAVAASRHHVVRPGETVASIARQYQVQAEALRFANELKREPSTGTRLLIP
jgi:N-acetylmuramoyl-L-alanine amidase